MKLKDLLEVLGHGTPILIMNMKNDSEIYRGTVEDYSGNQTFEIWNVTIVNGLIVIDCE